jgi:hypothetical protein
MLLVRSSIRCVSLRGKFLCCVFLDEVGGWIRSSVERSRITARPSGAAVGPDVIIQSNLS